MPTPPKTFWFVVLALVLAAIAVFVQTRRPVPVDTSLLAWLPPTGLSLIWVTPKSVELPADSPIGRRLGELEAEIEATSSVSLRKQVEQLVAVDRLCVAKGQFDWAKIRAALERTHFRVETFRGRELAVRDDDTAVAFDDGRLIAGKLDPVREALFQKDQKQLPEGLAGLARALSHPTLSPGLRFASRLDPLTLLGGDLARGLGLGSVAASLAGDGAQLNGRVAVFATEPGRLAQLDTHLEKLIEELRAELEKKPDADPPLLAVLRAVKQSRGDDVVLLSATVPARLVPIETVVGNLPTVFGRRPEQGAPNLEALGPPRGAVFAPHAPIEHRWSPIAGVDTWLLDFAEPGPDGRCAFDPPREVKGTSATLSHDDPKACLVWRVRPAGDTWHTFAGGPYTVGPPPGCTLPPDALTRCLETAAPR